MITLLLAAATAAAVPAAGPVGPPLSGNEDADYAACVHYAQTGGDAAVEWAQAWRARGGGIAARQCIGIAYMALDRPAPAALTFEQAARAAEAERDDRVADLWAQAGNAYLVAGDNRKALTALDAAANHGGGSDQWKGEVYIDRARVNVAMDDVQAARTDLDKALELVPGDPMAWLLSATLARRMNDVDRAAKDIAQAERRAPDSAEVAVEAGNIAATAGDIDKARAKWGEAVKLAPASTAGKAAAAAIAANSP